MSKHNQLVEALKKILVSDKEFEEVFASARVSKAALARYILRELEHTASPDKGEEEWVNADPHQITLEHILRKALPATGRESFDADTHAEFKARLGNLCLLRRSENNGMPNGSFAAKKPFFEKSSLTTTAALGECEGWSPQELEDRQQKMATLALKAWPAA
ncbi:HNH endonuclease family protein [Oceanibium sediminis]|uniref:HNH endonuclease family protein n=1 Tax=Oceanibium sediminis TaxID=2026339 RepID=UPI000DD42697